MVRGNIASTGVGIPGTNSTRNTSSSSTTNTTSNNGTPSKIDLSGINKSQQILNSINPLNQASQFRSDGFLLPSAYSSDGTNLPYNSVPDNRNSQLKRNIVTWFIPQFGIVRMYVNPQSISYQHKKIITKDRTKGGYTLQYWGEDLTNIAIGGTTGSSGIEGINILYEIYRAEQYAFDSTGLLLAANNASADLNNSVNAASNALGPVGGSILKGVSGFDSSNASLASKNIPSLAQLAFTVEMYYNGWVYRGFFENMTINERADNFLLEYQMNFVATQKRGYRTNYFPWTRSAKDGPSNYGSPQSFSGSVATGQ